VRQDGATTGGWSNLQGFGSGDAKDRGQANNRTWETAGNMIKRAGRVGGEENNREYGEK
jgi:hypothetical protein